MKEDVKYWLFQILSGIFDKDILIKVLSGDKHIGKPYRQSSTNYMNNYPIIIGKVVPFNKKKNDPFHLYNMLNNNVMKFAIASVLVVLFMSILNMPFINAEKPAIDYVTVQVYSGDTVWTIASQYASNKEDVRDLVYAIKTMNELNHNVLIYPGQTLKVPTLTNYSMEVLHTPP